MSIWWLAIRPKTLAAACCPVVIGIMLAYAEKAIHWPSVWVILITALLIQIGTNFANDYYDFIKGADTADRKGPTRATQAGLVTPETMKRAMKITFGLAFMFGLILVFRGGWPILLIGCLSILFGVLYTGGPYPLAYIGLGDVFVFVFFGPVAVAGTYYLMTQNMSWMAAWIGMGPGLISTALLAVNNLRDIDEDKVANKRTLAVRWGAGFAKMEFITCLVLAIHVPIVAMIAYDLSPMLLITILAVFPAGYLVKECLTKTGEALNGLLAKTGAFLIVYTL